MHGKSASTRAANTTLNKRNQCLVTDIDIAWSRAKGHAHEKENRGGVPLLHVSASLALSRGPLKAHSIISTPISPHISCWKGEAHKIEHHLGLLAKYSLIILETRYDD